jgi:hypothetical protein
MPVADAQTPGSGRAMTCRARTAGGQRIGQYGQARRRATLRWLQAALAQVPEGEGHGV